MFRRFTFRVKCGSIFLLVSRTIFQSIIEWNRQAETVRKQRGSSDCWLYSVINSNTV